MLPDVVDDEEESVEDEESSSFLTARSAKMKPLVTFPQVSRTSERTGSLNPVAAW